MFGYVTDGMETIVPKLETGDVIVKAVVVEGADRLVRPSGAAGGGGGGEAQLVAEAP